MAESNDCITAAKPDGRGELSSANSKYSENTQQSARMQGFPFEGLQSAIRNTLDNGIPRAISSSTGKIIISQDLELDTDYNSPNEARLQLEGVASNNYLNVPYTASRVEGTAENEAEVNKSHSADQGLSMAYYQQQIMMQQQLMLQQTQTVNSLIGKVDNLAKIVEQKKSTETEISGNKLKVKVNQLNKRTNQNANAESRENESSGRTNQSSNAHSRAHEISDVSDVNNSDGESSEDENWGLERQNSEDSNSDYESDSELGKDISMTTNEQTNNKVPTSNKDCPERENVSKSMKLLKQLGQKFDNIESVSSKVDETLANVVNAGLRAKINRKEAKEMCEKHTRPENCTGLKVPKLNKELWLTGALGHQTKEQDKTIQTAQKYLTYGLMPLVKLMDDLLQDDNSTTRYELANESFQMLAYAHRDMSNVRRQLIKPNIAEKYKQLCNDSTPLTDNLLGDDLEKQIKTVDEMGKVGKSVSKGKGEKRKYKGNDFDKQKKFRKQKFSSGNRDRFDGSFLDRRARFHKPGGVHNKNNNKRNQK